MNYFSLYFFLFSLCIFRAGSLDIPFGDPDLIPQSSSYQGQQIQAVSVNLPLLPPSPSDPPPRLSLLKSGFLCPASPCSPSPSPPSSCPCDYTLPCAALPPCCAADPVFSLACGPDHPSPAFLPLSPGLDLLLPAVPPLPSAPLYLRYHPSPASRCRGFSFDLRPHPSPPAPQPLSPLFSSFQIAVSLSSPTPDTDPGAWRYAVRYTDITAPPAPTWCPAPSLGANPNVTLSPLREFLPLANDRTVFFALSSATLDAADAYTAVPAAFHLAETKPASEMALVDASSSPLPSEILDGQSLLMRCESGQYDFVYRHAAAECRNVTVSTRALNGGDTDLYADYYPEQPHPWYTTSRWSSFRYDADSLTLQLCPGEAVAIDVTMYTGDFFFLSLASDAPLLVLDVLSALHPLSLPYELGWRGASRLVCAESATPSSFSGSPGEVLFPCAAFTGAYPDNCVQHFPAYPGAGASLLWPTPPTPTYFDPAALRRLNASQIAQYPGLSLVPLEGVYASAAVLQASALDSPVVMTYLTQQQLGGCRLELLGALCDQWGRRLSGTTPPLRFSAESGLLRCENATGLEGTTAALLALNDEISGAQFAQRPQGYQLSALFSFARYQLQPQYAACDYLINNGLVRSQTVDLSSHSVVANSSLLLNCSGYDPCCSSPYPTTPLYAVCEQPPSSFFLVTEPQYARLDAQCPDALCLPAFLSEISQFRTHPTVPGQVDDVCTASHAAIQPLVAQSLAYYRRCKARFLGPADDGLLCTSDAQCAALASPAFRCMPSPQGGLLSSALPFSAAQRLRRRTCQAPTAVFDALILDCWTRTMPAYLSSFLSALSLPVPAQFSAAVQVPGCRMLDPSPLLAAAPRWYELTTPDLSCPYRSGCPYPVTLLDHITDLPYLCTGAFASCSHSLLGPLRADLADEAGCLAHRFRCNRRLSPSSVQAPADASSPAFRFHVCQGAASLADCQAECAALYGGAFCGHCPGASNRSDCLQLVDASDPAAAVPVLGPDACAATPSCYHADLGILVAGQCGDTGSCNIADGAPGASLGSIVTRQSCLAQRGLCVDDVQRTVLSGNGCYGGFTSRYSFNGRTVPHGRFLDPADFPNLASPAACDGFPDNAFPSRFMHWVPPVATRGDCLGNEDLFVCFLPDPAQPGEDAATPVLYNRSLCAQSGGQFRSPYTWVDPVFTPGVDVLPEWVPASAQPAAEWGERVDFGQFAALLTAAIDQWQISAQVDQTLCAAAGSYRLAINSIPCECGDSAEPRSCPLFSTSSAGIPPPQLLGRAPFCSSAQIDDNVTYPGIIDLSTVSLSTLGDASSLRHIPSSDISCLTLSVFSYSSSLFLFARSRSRQTSFFLSRQDEIIAPLSTLTSRYTPNGLILSDGFQFVSHLPRVAGKQLQVCIQPRFDFIAYLNATLDARAYHRFTHLRFALFENWRVVPFSRARQPRISVTYLPEEGDLITVNGSALEYPITHIYRICGVFDRVSFAESSAPILVVSLSRDDPEAIDNGFSTAETVWLYITACCFVVPVVLHLMLACYLYFKDSLFTGNQLVCAFLVLFMVFRATLLFSLADGTLVANSTTEFGLTDAGTLCEFLAILLEFYLLQKLLALANSTPMSPLPHIALALFLVCIFIGFVLAYGLVGDASGGISRPSTTCFGRIPVTQTDWDAHRIIRFVDQLILAIIALGLGICQIRVSYGLYRYHKRCQLVMDHKLLRLSIATGIFAFALLTHAVISVILIATQYNNFIFGMTLTWITELLPSIIYLILAEISTTQRLVRSLSSKLSSSSRSKSHRST